ncbi:MAG: 30S ribosomal protein S3, partial [Nitrosopumilaceae archaeon]
KQKQKEEIVVKVTADKPVSTIKVETEAERTVRTESEQIELEAKKIATLETLEEEEAKFKA